MSAIVIQLAYQRTGSDDEDKFTINKPRPNNRFPMTAYHSQLIPFSAQSQRTLRVCSYTLLDVFISILEKIFVTKCIFQKFCGFKPINTAILSRLCMYDSKRQKYRLQSSKIDETFDTVILVVTYNELKVRIYTATTKFTLCQ